MEFTRSVEVGKGGRIELLVPGLQPGEVVEVRVQTTIAGERPHAKFGSLKGLIQIHDDFDDPLPEFEDYS